jgi:hypothetical protein
MPNGYASVYLRRAFWVEDPAQVPGLKLTVDYDDSIVVYLNGVEVLRDNVAGNPPAHTSLATVNHECSRSSSGASPPRVYYLGADRLVAGFNLMALSAHNLTLGSSDFSVVASLEAGAPDPSLAVTGLVLARVGGLPELRWSPVAPGAIYDVASGLVPDFVTDRDAVRAQCLAIGRTATSFQDTRAPIPPAATHYYLVRARSGTEVGDWGQSSAGGVWNVPACH